MKKTTLKTLFTLLALLLVFVMVFTVAACAATEDTTTDDTASDDKDTSTKTSKNLVFSEDFSETSGTDQPYSPSSSWTTYTNNSDANKKVAGVIDTGASYDSAKTAWDSLKNPYGDPKDNKLLMIYNKEANVYGYHRSFQTAVATYYTITASVKTVNIVGTGASFRILSNNGTAAFSISDTDDFQTYTFYVLSALAKSDTINIYLTLGYGTDKVSGYAFFDDIEVKKISSADYKAAYEAAQENENPSNTKFVEMLQPDGEFNYYTSTTTTPYTASSWSTKTGGKVDDKALETNNTARGIVSTEAENWKTLSKAHVITLEKEPEAEEATKLYYFPEDSNPGITAAVSDNGDKNVLALRSMPTPNGSNAKYTPTAIGYESKTSIRINMSTIYEISVWVKASVDVDPEHENDPDYYKDRGAAVILNGTEKYSVKAIRTNNATNNGWEKVVFYIIGNEYSAKDFTIELWLGTDDSKDTLTQGVAYFDKLVVKEIETFTADTREEKVSEYKNIIQNEVAPGYVTRYADLIDLKSVKANMVTNHDFSTLDEAARPEGYTFAGIDSVVVNDGVDVIAKMISAEAIAATDEQWTETYKDIYKIDANPLYPYGFSNVLLVNNVLPSAYKVTQNQEIEIIQNLNYRLSVWVKTINLADSDNLTIALIDGDGTSKSTFSVNTNKTSASNDETEQDYANAYSNELLKGYVEYIFYIQGCNASDPNAKIKSDMVHLEFSLGSGTKYEPSGYRKGAYVIANINMEQITNPEYTSATTGTTANKVSFSSDSSNISNGNFNQYDLKNSEIDQDTGLPKLKDEFGNDGYYLAAIGGSDWTNNVNEGYGTTKVEQKTDKDDPSKVEEVKVNNLIAGILNINNTNSNDSNAYLKQFGLDDVEIFNNWATSVIDETKEKSVYFGKPNVLMITTRGNASVKLKNTYKENESDENEKTNDKSETPAIKSPSLSFDPNSYYVVKFYARAIGNVEKAIGQVYLTTSSTDAEKALHTIKVEDGWVEYIFLVETGLSKVEANLEIYFGEKFNLTTEYQGTLLFDGFTKVSIDKDAYDKYLTYESTKTTKFATTTFDTGSTTSETAVKPTLFSGSGASTSGYENSESQVAGVITYNSFKFDGAENKKTLGLLTTKTETDAEGNERLQTY